MAEIVILSPFPNRQYAFAVVLCLLIVLLYLKPYSNRTSGFNHSNLIYAATDTPQKKYIYIQDMPQFHGDIKQYILSHLHYPGSASRAGIQGRVVVTFIINTDSSVSNAHVVKSIGYGCDHEALRIINNMPRWQPATQDGKPVKAPYTVAVPFTLD